MYMVENSLPCRVETNLFWYDTAISDLDNGMIHVSVRLTQDLHVEKFTDLVKVRFVDNVHIHLSHNNRIYQKVTKEMIARKWSISD